MDSITAIYKMMDSCGTTPYKLSRDMGRAKQYMDSLIRRGTTPRVDTMSEIALACGYRIVLEPSDPERPTLVIDPPTRQESGEE